MGKSSETGKIDRERYKRVMDCMTKEYFSYVFNQLVERWQKNFSEEGERPSRRTLSKEKYLNVSNTIISDWMNGKHMPTRFEHFLRICTVFHVEPEIFAPNPVYVLACYSLEQIETLESKCAELKIDKNFLAFVKDNFDIPHSIDGDQFDYMQPARNAAPKNAPSDYVIQGKNRTAFLDEKDLILISELQSKIKALIDKDLNKLAIKYEKDFVNEAAGWSVDPDYREAFVENVTERCNHLDADYIAQVCKKHFDKKDKRK